MCFMLVRAETKSHGSQSRRHLSGNHVIPNEDEVDVLVSCNPQCALDALQVCSNAWQSGRLGPAVAAENTRCHPRNTDTQ